MGDTDEWLATFNSIAQAVLLDLIKRQPHVSRLNYQALSDIAIAQAGAMMIARNKYLNRPMA